MAIKPPPPPWEVLQQVGEMVGNPGLRDEVDKGVRTLAQGALTRLDVVSREEFDVQAEILKRTRERVVALEAELEKLTAELETLAKEN
ncbi:accessory factor UbiK family protein [Halioglobus maricola]|uniref:Ubiquinone biosynthesis accessory factor UbiK n=1 Tax=Halioglobus maricola TaxID=2601894 RepID=A0A5P9NPD6_9GAMM|nr:accessory factor UbiK family protein [Halioglobus maricola]QFU77134.1 accessory factor UbiK family protein [Halioglobus maricola]